MLRRLYDALFGHAYFFFHKVAPIALCANFERARCTTEQCLYLDEVWFPRTVRMIVRFTDIISEHG